MIRLRQYHFLPLILMLAVLASACGPLLTPVSTRGAAPTPILRHEGGATDDPNVFVDQAPFQAALLQAIQSRDEAKLEKLMAVDFANGTWRGEINNLSRADALRELYQDQLGDDIQLDVAARSELSALMGGINPLDILGSEVNVVDAIFVTGWGKDGADEAILYVSRQPDRSLRWAGTLLIKGGFTSPETGGVQPLVNTEHGYQMYLPLGYEVSQPLSNTMVITAPPSTQGHRERAFIEVEPANGRTAEQMAAETKADLPSGFSEQAAIDLQLDTETAVILDRVPSQDMQRVLFVVHEGRLYRMIFIPHDETAGEAYNQMKHLYAVIVNTFKFLPAPDAGLNLYLDFLAEKLAKHDKAALQPMIGEPFTLAAWQNEGVQITQAQAIEQILNNYAPVGAQLIFDPDHPVVAQLFPDPLKTGAGDDLIPVYVSGWGLEGKDEAILFIARRAGGAFYWQGVTTAAGGFEP